MSNAVRICLSKCAAPDIRTQSTARFPGDAQVHIPGTLDLPSAQGHVAVHTTMAFASFTDRVEIAETICKIAHLVILVGAPIVANHFL